MTAAGIAGPWGAQPAAAVPGPQEQALRHLFTHPVIGTWRGTVSFSDDKAEQTLLAFYPGGMFTAFTDGIHVAVGRWEGRDDRHVTFGLWQVLPVDIHGLPHTYEGEVRALHQAELSGDTLVSHGEGRGLDIDGNVVLTFEARVRAVRFGLTLPGGG
ncbi:hypothetical protein GCM10010129_68160 [Streptomyces fumigatiscleroticus]|nr:hypothetical protein GCM10010129_68160 [Streptomyces fumigatiscleroticus]